MKKIFVPVIAAALFAISAPTARAEPRNDTPHALACMNKYGFTYADWRAYAVPAEKANRYRACRDGGKRSR